MRAKEKLLPFTIFFRYGYELEIPEHQATETLNLNIHFTLKTILRFCKHPSITVLYQESHQFSKYFFNLLEKSQLNKKLARCLKKVVYLLTVFTTNLTR